MSDENDEYALEVGPENSAKVSLQMEMILGDEAPYVNRSKKPANHTCERLEATRPDLKKAAIKLLAAGIPVISIANRLCMSEHTVRELRYRCATDINEQKAILCEMTFAGLAMSLDKTIELIPETKNAKDSAIVSGILGDKYLQLSGQATSRIEITAKIDFRGEMQKLNDELAAKLQEMKRAEVVEVTALEDVATT